jgi:hypothetical protein
LPFILIDAQIPSSPSCFPFQPPSISTSMSPVHLPCCNHLISWLLLFSTIYLLYNTFPFPQNHTIWALPRGSTSPSWPAALQCSIFHIQPLVRSDVAAVVRMEHELKDRDQEGG